MTLSDLTHEQLLRHHDQALVALSGALNRSDLRAYRVADNLETDCRMEMLRRMDERNGP